MGLFDKKDKTPAQTVIEDVCAVKKNERVLIVANPETNIIAQKLFTAAIDCGARPVLVYQSRKSAMDNAEEAVVGALKSGPDVLLSVSSGKFGKDSEAIAKPYELDGVVYDNTFDYLLYGKKTMRAVWTPGLTQDMFERTVNIDYKALSERCGALCARYREVVQVHVTSPNGTDIVVPVAGRTPFTDNGDFSKPGSGGNIPAGEVFISPVVGSGNRVVMEGAKKVSSVLDFFAGRKNSGQSGQEEAALAAASPEKEGCSGTIVFDGSMTFSDGDALLETPITVTVEEGFVKNVSGGEEAKRLLKDIIAAEREALALEASGKIPQGQGAVYCRNARNIGELGIGLNPAASVTGNMLEDEKAFRTCHFAIGQNYDGDAPALIHFDGVVRNPTIVFKYADGSEFTVLDNGELQDMNSNQR